MSQRRYRGSVLVLKSNSGGADGGKAECSKEEGRVKPGSTCQVGQAVGRDQSEIGNFSQLASTVKTLSIIVPELCLLCSQCVPIVVQ